MKFHQCCCCCNSVLWLAPCHFFRTKTFPIDIYLMDKFPTRKWAYTLYNWAFYLFFLLLNKPDQPPDPRRLFPSDIMRLVKGLPLPAPLFWGNVFFLSSSELWRSENVRWKYGYRKYGHRKKSHGTLYHHPNIILKNLRQSGKGGKIANLMIG